ncbi:hypothetical protein [Natrinema versiforme]|uniref:Uncharacterized protein n=1 Tax=Natrinema versiforme JCM 10478 TaxID=1227496 RepID=L9YDV0_9EURY|nr:hypothetical protein [Natrinema versiforme]ELY71068.1 hypothetical protein C489_01891 [Natrinema versiforme JCM 10478]
MGLRNPFKWTLVYRAITVGALGLGLALVAAGFLAGFGGAITGLLADPLNPGPAIESANPMITLLFAALGIVVWQLGKSYALFVTLPRAAGRAAGRQLDANRLASEVHDGLDDRLADMEAELAETRRAVEALEEGGRTATFDEREHLDDDAAAGDTAAAAELTESSDGAVASATREAELEPESASERERERETESKSEPPTGSAGQGPSPPSSPSDSPTESLESDSSGGGEGRGSGDDSDSDGNGGSDPLA